MSLFLLLSLARKADPHAVANDGFRLHARRPRARARARARARVCVCVCVYILSLFFISYPELMLKTNLNNWGSGQRGERHVSRQSRDGIGRCERIGSAAITANYNLSSESVT